ncbi:hypothetical protein CQW32_20415 [Pseudomonas putida]|jgi:RAQPRD family integrative conjugative element protein|uniref:integrative conjugative element protein, RAQPRD family n=1 Tax=Pseudomonas putida TaxID=303 RepID=UPI000C2AE602|nr:RAQPRD family integrative conjugative element protein [Pseudomonas putida]MBF8160942.1 RAQPRD family integrative conjugative element protein [Pseudomonas mendocina]PJX08592.1 hypothetical protein CQW32_20415 [Pseudomonas putida]HCF5435879.1 RAQPRD family integrative conjugative element protein [Pseudomonas aeruginosa]
MLFPSSANGHHPPGFVFVLMLGLGLTSHAGADDSTPEHARLAAALRQLDSIERLVAQQAVQPLDESSRYHFDYARLAADLQRVRNGIRDYLTPTRAQPRDPALLLGDYRQSAPPLTEPESAP